MLPLCISIPFFARDRAECLAALRRRLRRELRSSDTPKRSLKSFTAFLPLSPRHRPGRVAPKRALHLRTDPEVSHHEVSLLVHKDVVGFDVTVDNIPGMKVFQAGGDIPDEPKQRLFIGVPDQRLRRVRSIRHHEERLPVHHIEVIGVQKVRMVQGI